MLPVIPFPFTEADAVAIPIWGPFAIRWYALAYIAGILLGWIYARWLIRRDGLWGGRPRPSSADLDDLVSWIVIGVVLGGRLAYIIVYNPEFYLANPLQVFNLLEGGMAFHGGLLGVVIAVWLVSRARDFSVVSVYDILGAVVPIGLFFGRIANFVNGELYGRPSDVPWAMVFPDGGPIPRHPSQLYQAFLEGIVLFAVITIALRMGALRRPGLTLGLFGAGYGLARIVGEVFRMPDPELGFLFGPVTMGMVLSAPMVLIGGAFVVRALRRPPVEASPSPAPTR